jgi:hypothetical protein
MNVSGMNSGTVKVLNDCSKDKVLMKRKSVQTHNVVWMVFVKINCWHLLSFFYDLFPFSQS